MSVIIWIVVIVCITAVTMTSIICSAKIEESKYETFACTVRHWISNETTTDELKKMVEKLMAATSKMKGK